MVWSIDEVRQFALLAGLLFTFSIPAAEHQWRVPEGYPAPELGIDQALVDLGRHLFYEKNLSADRSLSCASCHNQESAFSDNRRQPTGIDGNRLPRHPMTLINLAYQSGFGWADNTTDSLLSQMQTPLFAEMPVEMGASRDRQGILERLRSNPNYVILFQAAFGVASSEISFVHVTEAIQAFELTLISYDAPFDKWVLEDRRPSESAVRGFKLFQSEKFGCSGCHHGLNFSSDVFVRSGVPTTDPGLRKITRDERDAFKFKVPGLRNVLVSAPYMHQGQFADIESVLRHYASGPNPAVGLAGFEISDAELEDIVAFFSTLTDVAFLTDPAIGPP